jgi:hypothetical protein
MHRMCQESPQVSHILLSKLCNSILSKGTSELSLENELRELQSIGSGSISATCTSVSDSSYKGAVVAALDKPSALLCIRPGL